MTTRTDAADRALQVVLAAARATTSSDRTDLALTLHMLEGHAPSFFARHSLRKPLDLAMAALDEVPVTFDGTLSWFEVMARVDALYLRRARQLPVPPFDIPSLQKTVEAQAKTSLLVAWLLTELARPLGVETAFRLPSTYPYRRTDPVQHIYQLTHEVLLATEYLARPLAQAQLEAPLDELEKAHEFCLTHALWDALGEVVFCLQAGGRVVPDRVIAALEARQASAVLEASVEDARRQLHSTATALLALAHQRQ